MNKLIILLIASSFGCSNSQKNELENNISEKLEDNTTYVEPQEKTIADAFNLMNYKTKVDSVLYDVVGSKSVLKTDTLQKGDLIFVELKGTPVNDVIAETISTVRHSFNLKNGDKRINHYLIVLSFSSMQKAELIFSDFEKLALEKSGVPGLTYTNDYLVNYKDKIYWINSGCILSYFNHSKIVNEFREIIKVSGINSIQCECGQVICKTNLE